MSAFTALRILQTAALLGILWPTGVLTKVKVNITITPSILNLTSQEFDRSEGHLSVTCDVTQSSSDVVQQLSIHRKVRLQPGQEHMIAKAIRESKEGHAELLKNVSGGGVFGSLSQGFIGLTLNRATCMDEGKYVCRAKYTTTATTTTTTTKSTGKTQESQNLSVRLTPSVVTLMASPDQGEWTTGDKLTITCRAPTATDQSKVAWVWEYREGGDASWTSCDGVLDDVRTDLLHSTNDCYELSLSTVTRSLNVEDSKRSYRCYMRIGKDSFQKFAAEYNVGIVRPSTDDHQYHRFRFVWLGAGICGGIVVTATLAFILWKRRLLPFKAAARNSDNCPLLPPHSDPGWYGYGEYLEPTSQVSREEE